MIDMDSCLIDTSILARLVNSSDVLPPVAFRAIDRLAISGTQFYITPQNLIEFRNMATRPIEANGLGYSLEEAKNKSEIIERLFPLLEETPDIFPAWKSLAEQAGVQGKQVHDARLAAICEVYGIHGILTFNVKHFVRFMPHIPHFVVIDPHNIDVSEQ